MSEHEQTKDIPDREDQTSEETDRTTTATAEVAPAKPRVRRLPPWRVILHNDDVNEIMYVIDIVLALTPLNRQDASLRTLEAHYRGCSQLLTTHREHAELLAEQFSSRKLTVTIEPA